MKERLDVALAAARGAGAALMRLPRNVRREEKGDQLKTAADQAAEGWVLGYIRGYFPNDRFLAEEDFEGRGAEWDAPESYWTVDALDGTRSFADGFDGFCVQVAWVERGIVQVGVVYEPPLDQTYFAMRGHGAFRDAVRLKAASWSTKPRFVDSTRPKGIPGDWFAKHDAEFVELGSIGLKICRIADGSADVFFKALNFKTWDVAPGSLILEEAGGTLGLWDGSPVVYDTSRVRYANILATHGDRFTELAREISEKSA